MTARGDRPARCRPGHGDFRRPRPGQGLRTDQIAALAAGARPADLDADELLAADVATALTRGGAVPGPLYDAAVATLGRDGFDAVVFIVVHYSALGTLLNAYDVPAGGAS